jgi:hypothetical protein
MNKLHLNYIEGINGNRIEVKLTNEKEELLNPVKTYYFGFDVSSTRENEAYALKDYQDNIRYGWNNPYYCLKPYVGDVLKDIVETYNIKEENIIYSAKNVFAGKIYDEKTTKEKFEKLLEEI